MEQGISNFQIENAFENIKDTDIDDNFVGVFPANHMNRLIDCKWMISKKGKISLYDCKQRQLWQGWHTLMEYFRYWPKNRLFFFRLVLTAWKFYHTRRQKSDRKNILWNRKTDKSRQQNNPSKFNLNAWKNLSKKELDNLSNTPRDFFYFIHSFGNKLQLRDFVNIWMTEDRIQDLDSATCGIFQIYFYDNLFNPNKSSKMQNQAKLNKKQ